MTKVSFGARRRLWIIAGCGEALEIFRHAESVGELFPECWERREVCPGSNRNYFRNAENDGDYFRGAESAGGMSGNRSRLFTESGDFRDAEKRLRCSEMRKAQCKRNVIFPWCPGGMSGTRSALFPECGGCWELFLKCVEALEIFRNADYKEFVPEC